MFRWEQLLAHRHWITLHAFGRELRLCARCSGVVLGFLSLKALLIALVSSLDNFIPFQTGFSISLILALPAIIDWTTQSLGFRESTNNLRVLTGFFEGVAVGLLSQTEAPSSTKLLVISIIALSILFMGILGRRLIKPVAECQVCT